MARPRKDTVDYFPHFVSWGKTIPILEARFGNDGYAVWFKLLELLGKAKGHFIEASDPVEWEFLLSKLRVDEVSGAEILGTLARLGTIDRELWEQRRVIWCENFVNNLQELYRKRREQLPQRPFQEVSGAETSSGEGFPARECDIAQHSIAQHSIAEKESAIETTAAAPPPEPPPPKFTEQDLCNADALRDAIMAIDPEYFAKAKIVFKRSVWAESFRLIRERDNRAQEDIDAIIIGLPHDPFWAQNIRSPDALRGRTKSGNADKFLTVLASIKKIGGRQNGRVNGHRDRTSFPSDAADDALRRALGA